MVMTHPKTTEGKHVIHMKSESMQIRIIGNIIILICNEFVYAYMYVFIQSYKSAVSHILKEQFFYVNLNFKA